MNYHKMPFYFLALVEAMVIVGALAMSTFVDGGQSPTSNLGLANAGLATMVVLFIMFAVGLYDWRFAAQMVEVVIRLVAAVFLTLVAFAFLVYVASAFSLPPMQAMVAVGVMVPALVIARLAFFQLTDLDRFKARALVLGTGARAQRVAELDNGTRRSRVKIVGFVDCERTAPVVARDRVRAVPESLADMIREERVDEVIVAMEDRRGQLPLDDLITARLAGVAVSDYQTFCEQALGRIDLDALRPSWFLYSDGFRKSRFDRWLKRAFDVAVSLAFLLLFAPILLVTAIAIKLDSRGPVFYRQERVGLGGKPFTLIKFRSMTVEAEQDGAPQWAKRNDPRVTAVGSFIRKVRIDETPQLINVLKGEMSIVGPRPERPYFVDMLAQEIRFYPERHTMKPGVTGWAQVNYNYGASLDDSCRKLEYDLFYIKYFSILLDCLILAQTVRVVLWAEGAR